MNRGESYELQSFGSSSNQRSASQLINSQNHQSRPQPHSPHSSKPTATTANFEASWSGDPRRKVMQNRDEQARLIFGDEVNRPEVALTREVVPTLDLMVVMEILHGNEYDVERSIDAALALAASLEVEKGSAVLHAEPRSHTAPSPPKPPPTATRRQLSAPLASKISPRASPPAPMNPQLLRAKSLPENDSSPRAHNAIGSDSDFQSPAGASSPLLSSLPLPPRHVSSHSSHRGFPLLLPETFLVSPRYRLVVDRHCEAFTDYTVSFLRRSVKLGITIQEVEGQICIHTLHMAGANQPMLALESGIRVGDILTGINGDYFSPGVEVQDVIDILQMIGVHVSLHLTRRRKPEDPSAAPFHKLVQLLMDQELILRERAGHVSKALYRLKDRVLLWDSSSITQRIESWKLDAGINVPVSSRPISMRSSKALVVGGGFVSNMEGLFRGSGDRERERERESNRRKSDVVVPTKNLRPGLSVRILRTEEKLDHTVYLVWVLDVKSGAEWIVRRRFREFHEFKEVLAGIRPAINRLEFPPKRINVAETTAMVSERMVVLQKFLRKICSMVCVNSLHPSTARIQLALQQFLEVDNRAEIIAHYESQQGVQTKSKSMVQVYAYSVLQMAVMDKVLCGFIESYHDDTVTGTATGDGGKVLSEEEGRSVLNELREFTDNLQAVLCDGIADDCLDIMLRYGAAGEAHAEAALVLTGSSGLKPAFIDARSSSSSRSAGASLSAMRGLDRDNSREKMREDERRRVLAQCNEDLLRSQVRSAVRRQIEVELYVPCALRLRGVLQRSFAAAEAVLQKKITQICSQPQTFFGIPLSQISPSSWEESVQALRGVRAKTIPHDRLAALLAVAKSIPLLFAQEHPGAEKPLGADEFLPIFIYVLVRAQVPDLLALNEELQSLCDPEVRMSETGYYLATLEASLQHIVDADVTAGSTALFPDTLRSIDEDEESMRREDDDNSNELAIAVAEEEVVDSRLDEYRLGKGDDRSSSLQVNVDSVVREVSAESSWSLGSAWFASNSSDDPTGAATNSYIDSIPLRSANSTFGAIAEREEDSNKKDSDRRVTGVAYAPS